VFLSLPFLFVQNYKSISNIKIKDIEIFKIDSGIIIQWTNKNDRIAVINAQDYTALNYELDKFLSSFSIGNNSKLKHITKMKNSLKYSDYAIFKKI
jgi:hypothetical protein